MIDPEELRIGNYLHYNGALCEAFNINRTTVRCFVDNDLGEHDFYNEELDSIPLTEEWLLEFGFEKAKSNDNSFHLFLPEAEYGASIDYYKGLCILRDCDNGAVGKEIKYVHQLQNLYFALTGENLIVDKP